MTGLTLAALLLGTKALFFFADNGYPDFNRVENGVAVGPTCADGRRLRLPPLPRRAAR